VLLELVPGGYVGQIYATKVARTLEGLQFTSPVAVARKELATELLSDLCRLDEQMKELRQGLAEVVAASGTTTTKVFGVGPVIAAMVVGLTGDVRLFPSRAHFAAYNATAPIEVSSGEKKLFRLSMRGNRQLNHAVHMVAVTQIRNLKTEGRAYTSANSSRARQAKKHYGHSKDASATPSTPPWWPTHPKPRTWLLAAREGKRGTALLPARPAHTPRNRLFGQATPGPIKSLELLTSPGPSRRLRKPEEPLDTQRGLVPRCRVALDVALLGHA
jgi:transposase